MWGNNAITQATRELRNISQKQVFCISVNITCFQLCEYILGLIKAKTIRNKRQINLIYIVVKCLGPHNL